VQMACSLCQRVQDGLVGRKGDQIKAKDDDSPVTVAGVSSFVYLFVCLFIHQKTHYPLLFSIFRWDYDIVQ